MKRELVSFRLFKEYAYFLLKNHLDDLVKEDIARSRTVDLPLLKLFEHLSEPELFELSKKGITEYLHQIVEERALDAVEKSMLNWKEDKVPGIPRDKVVASDIALIYNVRKHSLLTLLPSFTKDITKSIELIKEIEDYYTYQESKAIHTYSEINKDEISKREKRLKESQSLAKLGYWEYDFEANTVTWSEELFNLYALDPSKGIDAATIGKHIYEEDITPLMQKVQEIYSHGGTFTCEYRIRNSKGETRTLIDKGYTEREPNGKLLVKGISQDITEQKKAEEELQKVKALVDASQDFIAIVDLNGNAYFVNDAGQKLVGLNGTEEVRKTKILEYFPDSLKEFVSNTVIPEVLKNGHWEGDVQFENFKTQETVDVSWNVFLIRAANGNPVGIGCVSQDIRPRKKYESLIKAKQTQLEEAQNIAHLGSWEWDTENNIVSWSDEMYRLFGYQPGEVYMDYETYLQHIHPEDRSLVESSVFRCYQHQIPYTFENRIIRKDGAVRWLYAKGKVLHAENGKAIRLGGIAMDITMDKRKEDALKQRTIELEAINKELEAFCYTISHDLRSPLRAIDGFGRRLSNQYLNVLDLEGQRLLNVVRTNAQQMGVLIDSLLEFSRLNRRNLKKSAIEMKEVVLRVIEEISQQDPYHRASFALGNLQPSQGDADLIKQVWQNLISNAIKFSSKKDSPLVEIGSEVKGDEVVYYVKDNGTGFDMEYADKLFGVFQRLHSEEEFKGTGVGLATVQRIIHRHGGKVWANGEPGKGAIFYFTLQTTNETKEIDLYLEKNK